MKLYASRAVVYNPGYREAAKLAGFPPGCRLISTSDERGAYVADRWVSIGDLFATLYKAFGIDWTKEYLRPIGRPLKIANSNDDETGRLISELIQ